MKPSSSPARPAPIWVKQWGEDQPQLSDKYDKTKIAPPANDVFSFLRPEGSDLYDYGKLHLFTLGCAKALAKKRDKDQTTLLEMLNKVEAQQREIATLRQRLDELAAKGNVSG